MPMDWLTLKSAGWTKGILLVSLCAVLATGIPVTIVHSHSHSSVGHVHDFAETLHSHEHEHSVIQNDAEQEADSLHVHAVDVMLLVVAPSVDPGSSDPALPSIIRSTIDSWLPDKPVSVLYRPPIA